MLRYSQIIQGLILSTSWRVFMMTWETITTYLLPVVLGAFGGLISPWVANVFQRSQSLWIEKKNSYDEISKALGMAVKAAGDMEQLTSWNSSKAARDEATDTFSAGMGVIKNFAARGSYLISREAIAVLKDCAIDVHNVFEHENGPDTDLWYAATGCLRGAVGRFNSAAKVDRANWPRLLRFRRAYKSEHP